MEEAKPHFFKVVFGDFDDRLQIPKAFLENISETSSGMATLEGPSGSNWHVKINRTSDGVYIEDGWRSFSRDHSLSLGEFLVFRYNGNASFSVQIFGTGTVERQDAFMVKNSQQETKCEGIKRRGRPPKISSIGSKRTWSTLKPCELSQNAGLQEEACIHEPSKTYQFDQSSSYQDQCDTSEEYGATEFVKLLDLKNLSFTLIVKPSYKLYLPIPSSFTKKHFTANTTSVTLMASDGRTWPVECIKNDNNYYRLTKGWSTFRTDIALIEAGNTCVFELIGSENVVLKVHIFQKA